MRKILALMTIAASLMFGTQSCKKATTEVQTLTQSVTATLAPNQNYTFTLPPSPSGHPYAITTQAANFALSQVGPDSLGKMVYQYTPAKDYLGGDKVILSSLEGPKPMLGNVGNHNGGDCNKKATEMVITINLTVADSSAK